MTVFYQIMRNRVPNAAAHYRASGEFVQVFPFKAVYPDKASWIRWWYIYGDEEVVAYLTK
jgi:hypothetical protein